jgi:hypothetical protein
MALNIVPIADPSPLPHEKETWSRLIRSASLSIAELAIIMIRAAVPYDISLNFVQLPVGSQPRLLPREPAPHIPSDILFAPRNIPDSDFR